MSAIAAVRSLAMHACQPDGVCTGYDVTKEYYVNDAGSQIEVLANSAFCAIAKRWAKTSARSRRGFIPETTWFR
jgi:hypothetical protein